jgi:hypothetical protein
MAQAASHAIWYLDVRTVQAGHVLPAMGFDAAYGLLSLYAFKYAVEAGAPRSAIVAYVTGGVFGTLLGMHLPL